LKAHGGRLRSAALLTAVMIGIAMLCTAALPGARAAPAAVDMQSAIDANDQLVDPVLQVRFEHIAGQLRCLVCQNESIADSNVELASDLRRQVREMLVAGKSDDAILDYMTDRYGEFVRFSPPLEAKTLLIWGAPFIVLLVGVGIIVGIVRRRSRMPIDDEPTPDHQ
jgi:cytochrome c-type biogenesis protein CcmH